MLHKKFCKTSGCKNLTSNRNGYCDYCNAKIQAASRYRRIMTEGTDLQEVQTKRPSASERGYNHEWAVFAKNFLLKHPTCARCGKPAQVVDHKTMTARRMIAEYGHFILDEDLYQPLCFKCNNLKAKTLDALDNRELKTSKAEFEKGILKWSLDGQTPGF